MAKFRIGHRIFIDEICLDSTARSDGGQKQITVHYDDWKSGKAPSLKTATGNFATIKSQTDDTVRNTSSFVIEATRDAQGVTYVFDGNSGDDTLLRLTIGRVKNQKDMEIDLIAELGRSENPIKLWAYQRILASKNNIIGNRDDWDRVLKDQPLKQITDPDHPAQWNCGGALNKFGNDFFGAKHNTIASHYYYKRMKPNQSGVHRLFIDFLNSEIKLGAQRMKKLLSKGDSIRIFAIHHDGFGTNGDGRIKPSGLTHYVTIVGCDSSATKFLTVDPWPGGSKCTYTSGIFGDVTSVFMGSLGVVMKTGEWAVLGEILATPDGSQGVHTYFVLSGG